ncbi:MAG TPA: DNA polymerase III subunit delta [Gaiellaceae bacterium]|nr:DNA polymerase III subunit delta [Gaiellaceae bacterium]
MAEAPEKPVYLMTGSDRPKVDTALARLRVHFEAESIELLSALEVSGDETAGLCNAGSLFGSARLVVVTEVDGVKAERGRRGGWKAADVEAIATYLASPAPTTVLALVAEDMKPSSALWKACEKNGRVLTYDVEKGKLKGWVAEQFRQRGARAEPEAVEALVRLIGDDLRALKVEVDKIATWAGDEPVGEREVTALVASSTDVPGYELTEAWAARDVARALELSETTFEQDPKPRRDVALRLAGTLGAHLGRLRAIKRLAAEGVSSKEAATRLKLKPYYAGKLYRQAEGFSEDELDGAALQLAALDGALKGQSRLAPDLELQRALAALSRPPGGR